MGLYLEKLKDGSPLRGDKSAALIGDGARELFAPWIGFQPNLVCVVKNETYDAAAYIYNWKEFLRFRFVVDVEGLPTRWFIYQDSPEIARMAYNLAKDDLT